MNITDKSNFQESLIYSNYLGAGKEFAQNFGALYNSKTLSQWKFDHFNKCASLARISFKQVHLSASDCIYLVSRIKKLIDYAEKDTSGFIDNNMSKLPETFSFFCRKLPPYENFLSETTHCRFNELPKEINALILKFLALLIENSPSHLLIAYEKEPAVSIHAKIS